MKVRKNETKRRHTHISQDRATRRTLRNEFWETIRRHVRVIQFRFLGTQILYFFVSNNQIKHTQGEATAAGTTTTGIIAT
jgi:hypothetical protein